MGENTVTTTDSILDSIKHLLGITSDNTVFDPDLIILINEAFADLISQGVGPQTGYSITSNQNVWSEFIQGENAARKENAKTYVWIKVKLVFDPPVNAKTIEVFESRAKEIAYRLYTEEGQY